MTNPKGLHFCGGLWQGCRFAPTPALPKDQPWGCFVLNTLHITLICLMRNGGGYGYFIMIQSCNLPLHTSSSAKSTPLSPTPREAA